MNPKLRKVINAFFQVWKFNPLITGIHLDSFPNNIQKEIKNGIQIGAFSPPFEKYTGNFLKGWRTTYTICQIYNCKAVGWRLTWGKDKIQLEVIYGQENVGLRFTFCKHFVQIANFDKHMKKKLGITFENVKVIWNQDKLKFSAIEKAFINISKPSS